MKHSITYPITQTSTLIELVAMLKGGQFLKVHSHNNIELFWGVEPNEAVFNLEIETLPLEKPQPNLQEFLEEIGVSEEVAKGIMFETLHGGYLSLEEIISLYYKKLNVPKNE